MKTILILSIFTIFSLVNADLCNFHASLIETDSFYFTQPYDRNISIDLSNYKQAFQQLDQNLNNFSTNLDFFDTPQEIANTEPLELKPFSGDYNAFKVNETVYGFKFFSACSRHNGSLVHITKQNKNLIQSLLRQFGMEKSLSKLCRSILYFHSRNWK